MGWGAPNVSSANVRRRGLSGFSGYPCRQLPGGGVSSIGQYYCVRGRVADAARTGAMHAVRLAQRGWRPYVRRMRPTAGLFWPVLRGCFRCQPNRRLAGRHPATAAARCAHCHLGGARPSTAAALHRWHIHGRRPIARGAATCGYKHASARQRPQLPRPIADFAARRGPTPGNLARLRLDGVRAARAACVI